jgi:hypothetical protein
VERKKKPKATNSSRTKSDITCWDCGVKGHTAQFCRTYLQGKEAKDEDADGDAQAAEGSADEDGESVEDDGDDDEE